MLFTIPLETAFYFIFFFIFVVLSIISTTYCFGRDLIYLLVRVCVYMCECKHDGEEACGSVHTQGQEEVVSPLSSLSTYFFETEALPEPGVQVCSVSLETRSSFRPPFSALLGIEATGRCEREAWFVVSGCCDANFDQSCGFVSECFLL